MSSLSDFSANALSGEPVALSAYAGQVVLVVNVASKCGLTPQYEGLEALYRNYADKGLVILGFPCNQFAGQEPGTSEEIAAFCSLTYDVTFPMFAKIDVNGAEAAPLYQWLKAAAPGPEGTDIPWNFTKFLIARDGSTVTRFAPGDLPEALAQKVEALL